MGDLLPLCEYCEKIDFASLARGLPCAPSWTGKLGSGSRVVQSNCPSCKVVARAWYEFESLRSAKHSVLADWSGVQLVRPDSREPTLAHFGTLGVKLVVWDSCQQRRSHSLVDVPAEIDFDVVLSRICHSKGGGCEGLLGETCKHQPPETSGIRAFEGLKSLRLIDVTTMTLVEFGVSKERVVLPPYVALSYVWGSVPTVHLTSAALPVFIKPGELSRVLWRLPRTVNDAIVAVQKLKLRYLWVDSLCLIQNDEEDLQLGISVMDSIYRDAYLTIIAAEGDDANAGLPGVAPGT